MRDSAIDGFQGVGKLAQQRGSLPLLYQFLDMLDALHNVAARRFYPLSALLSGDPLLSLLFAHLRFDVRDLMVVHPTRTPDDSPVIGALAKMGIVSVDSAKKAIREMFTDERNVKAAETAYREMSA